MREKVILQASLQEVAMKRFLIVAAFAGAMGVLPAKAQEKPDVGADVLGLGAEVAKVLDKVVPKLVATARDNEASAIAGEGKSRGAADTGKRASDQDNGSRHGWVLIGVGGNQWRAHGSELSGSPHIDASDKSQVE